MKKRAVLGNRDKKIFRKIIIIILFILIYVNFSFYFNSKTTSEEDTKTGTIYSIVKKMFLIDFLFRMSDGVYDNSGLYDCYGYNTCYGECREYNIEYSYGNDDYYAIDWNEYKCEDCEEKVGEECSRCEECGDDLIPCNENKCESLGACNFNSDTLECKSDCGSCSTCGEGGYCEEISDMEGKYCSTEYIEGPVQGDSEDCCGICKCTCKDGDCIYKLFETCLIEDADSCAAFLDNQNEESLPSMGNCDLNGAIGKHEEAVKSLLNNKKYFEASRYLEEKLSNFDSDEAIGVELSTLQLIEYQYLHNMLYDIYLVLSVESEYDWARKEMYKKIINRRNKDKYWDIANKNEYKSHDCKDTIDNFEDRKIIMFPLVYEGIGNYETAARAFQSVIDLKDDGALISDDIVIGAYIGKARTLFRANEKSRSISNYYFTYYSDALLILEKGLEKYPNNPLIVEYQKQLKNQMLLLVISLYGNNIGDIQDELEAEVTGFFGLSGFIRDICMLPDSIHASTETLSKEVQAEKIKKERIVLGINYWRKAVKSGFSVDDIFFTESFGLEDEFIYQLAFIEHWERSEIKDSHYKYIRCLMREAFLSNPGDAATIISNGNRDLAIININKLKKLEGFGKCTDNKEKMGDFNSVSSPNFISGYDDELIDDGERVLGFFYELVNPIEIGLIGSSVISRVAGGLKGLTSLNKLSKAKNLVWINDVNLLNRLSKGSFNSVETELIVKVNSILTSRGIKTLKTVSEKAALLEGFYASKGLMPKGVSKACAGVGPLSRVGLNNDQIKTIAIILDSLDDEVSTIITDPKLLEKIGNMVEKIYNTNRAKDSCEQSKALASLASSTNNAIKTGKGNALTFATFSQNDVPTATISAFESELSLFFEKQLGQNMLEIGRFASQGGDRFKLIRDAILWGQEPRNNIESVIIASNLHDAGFYRRVLGGTPGENLLTSTFMKENNLIMRNGILKKIIDCNEAEYAITIINVNKAGYNIQKLLKSKNLKPSAKTCSEAKEVADKLLEAIK